MEAWNGEDVFRRRGLWGVIIVSERFVRFAEKHALSHFKWIPIDKYVWDPMRLLYSQPVPPTNNC